MALQVGELIFKVDWDTTLQSDCLSPGLANRRGRKFNMSRKFGRIDNGVGMDWNEEILFTLIERGEREGEERVGG